MTRDFIFCVFGAYLLGSISTGYYLVRFKTNQDIRDTGSGGVGARNVGRLLGKPGFVITFLGDALKGALAVFIARQLNFPEPYLSWVVVAVIAGNIWPPALRFRGGRGIATALGAYFVFDPYAALWLPIITVALMPTRIGFTLSGLTAFLLFPLVAYLLGRPGSVVGALVISTLVILFSHRSRLRRSVRRSFKT